MNSLKDYVIKNKEKFSELLGKPHGNIEFFYSNVIAKTKISESLESYTLRSHTESALKELKKYLDENNQITNNISNRHNINEDVLKDILFFSVFFHDMGKGTIEFYDDKIKGFKKSYHPLYSIYLLINQQELPKLHEVDYLTLAVLTHHTVLHTDLYASEHFKELPAPVFFDETIKFAEQYSFYYEKFFKKECPYHFTFDIPNKPPYKLLREEIGWDIQDGLIDHINKILKLSESSGKKEIKELYGFVTGNLIRADWLSSGSYNLDFPKIDKYTFIDKLKERAEEKEIDFKGLKEFQKVSCQCDDDLLIKIPTGEGKTEAALLWCLNNLKNKHTKIIYTMPTQVTSNAMYERLKNYFGNNVGIVHGTSSIILAKEHPYDEEQRWKEKIVGKTFSKPLTVATLDSFILTFFNIHKWPLSQLNLENCLLIVDEIHSYDWQMLGALRRILEELKIRNCKVVIMSATFPEVLEKEMIGDMNYHHLTQEDLFDSKPVILKKENLNISKKVDSILKYFNQRKKILIVVNTVEKSKQLYNILKKTEKFKTADKFDETSDLVLYHSQFIKKDRTSKEVEIEQKEKWKNKGLVLIATQVVEISLDIDFEILFTELAPIDSIVQRIGRINRRKNPEKLGKVFVQTAIDSTNKSGKWTYPYRKEIIEESDIILKEGCPSLGDLAFWVSLLYEKLLENPQIHFEFQNKFGKGFNKFNKIIEKGPYTLRFSTENVDEIAKILQLRDIDERFEKIDVIPKVIAEKLDEFEKYENSVGIYKWLFGKLEKDGLIQIIERFYMIFLDYNYEYGLKITKTQSNNDFIL
ncbi:CRISPR-associated helicase Cas3' [Methanobacterium formicicum]|uniref:CRISPR-associated helicase Cas3' n=1 Tax=Methanobacterium formicicum TaxID=2162 RepID=UPI0024908054|nr:CRISPR-associated helicase Cas3' [Methanobacterium formicicum]